MLKESENILRESKTHPFEKKFRFHMMEIEKSWKKSLKKYQMYHWQKGYLSL